MDRQVLRVHVGVRRPRGAARRGIGFGLSIYRNGEFKMRFLAKYVNKLNGKFMLLHSCLYFWYFIAAINRLIKEKDTICYGALNYMAILNQRQGEKLNKLWDTIRE